MSAVQADGDEPPPPSREEEDEPPAAGPRPGEPVRLGRSGGGVGVFATRALAAGEVILVMDGEVVPEPDRWTLQLGPGRHLLGEGSPGWELRHACEPNALALVEGAPPLRVVALRDVPEGEELTIDYCATEEVLAEPFECTCGSPRCCGVVRGWRFTGRRGGD